MADSWAKVADKGIEGHFNHNLRGTKMAVYQNNLYAGSGSGGYGLQVWRTDGAGTTPTWTRVATNGFDSVNNRYVKCMYANNDYLYIGVTNYGGTGCQLWRYDGSAWVRAAANGFGAGNIYLQALTEFGGYLYAGVEDGNGVLRVYRSDCLGSPPYTWNQFGANDLGVANNYSIDSLGVLDGYLYAGVTAVLGNDVEPGRVFRTDGVADGTEWAKVNTDWFGNNCRFPSTMCTWGSHLYVGCYRRTDVGGTLIYRTDGTGATLTWEAVNTGGFGDGYNEDIESMVVWNGQLYAGTGKWNGPDEGCDVWRTSGVGGPPFTDWQKVGASGFSPDENRNYADSMAVLGSYLYVGAYGNVNAHGGSDVFRTAGVGGPPFSDWKQVNADGFAPNCNDGVSASAFFQGDLYVGTSTQRDCQVWRYRNNTWQQVSKDGFFNAADRNTWYNQTIACMAAYGSYLYVATYGWTRGTQVWRTAARGGPPYTDWELVNTNGFGDTLNEGASMAVFGSYLYVGTENVLGCQVWRTAAKGGPPFTDWKQVNVDGFTKDDQYENEIASSMVVTNSKLYVGVWNSYSGCQVWASAAKGGPPYTDWQKVNTDGFGTNKNIDATSLAVFNQKLYAGTHNETTGCEVWKYNSGTSWSKVGSAGLGSAANWDVCSLKAFAGKLYAGTTNNSGGCEVRSSSGNGSWTKANASGFEGAQNKQACSMAVDGNKLYVGTYNDSGGAQVWKTVSPYYPTWYLAEGTTAWGYDCYISIENPNASAVHAVITYMTASGPVSGGTVTLPATSQATVNPRTVLGGQDFSTKVECVEGTTIAVDRTMTWTGAGQPVGEAHASIGVTDPALAWYLPEGSSAWGFECWLLIQNPNASDATCQVTYMVEGENPVVVTKTVPANSRKSYSMEADIGQKDASIMVTSDVPVIPERAMYRPKDVRREGHDSIGTTAPADSYYLAEGTTAWGFTTYVLVQNPSGAENEVSVTYMTSDGPVPHPQNPIKMPANSRKTIRVNDFLQGKDFSTRVTGTRPIIAERAMYWNGGPDSAEACHDSVGMAAPHKKFYLPDGQTGGGYETWTLIQNPNSTAVTVEITYMTPTGAGNVTKPETIPASSRSTFELGKHSGLSGRAAIMVTSKTAGKNIMVERAMYWNSRAAGTDTIGGIGD